MVQTMGEAVSAYLADQHELLMAGDAALRAGGGDVHALRVAARRYRSVLRVSADLFDPSRAVPLEAELSWYAGLLGAVRDLEVLRDALGSAARSLPADLAPDAVAARIEAALAVEQRDARAALTEALRDERYVAFLVELRAWNHDPPLTSVAARPARGLDAYRRRADSALRRRLRAARRHDDDEPWHRARKAGKRARYVAELSAAVKPGGSRRSLVRARAVQEVLGAHQDSVVSRQTLLRLAADAGEHAFAYGVLFAREAERASISRRAARRLRTG